MSQSLSMSEWMDALSATMSDIAANALGFSSCTILRTSASIPDGLEGAYLALVGEQDSIQIGLSSSAEGCQVLAKALLQMGPEDEDLPSGDVADAVCEVVNIIAGGIKGRVNGRVPPIKLGIPIFVHGTVQPSGRNVLVVAEALIGSVSAALVLVEPRGATSVLAA